MTGRGSTLLAVLAGLALLAGCTSCSVDGSSDDDGQPGQTDGAAVQNTTQACPEQPDTAATGAELMPRLSFDCLGGGSVDFADAPGVPTVLNAWGSWCPPCREELPVMQQLADAAGDEVRVLGLVSADGRSPATSFASDAGISFPNAYDSHGDTLAQLGLAGAPYTLFLDAQGAIVYTQRGQVHSLDELEQLVRDHLGVQL